MIAGWLLFLLELGNLHLRDRPARGMIQPAVDFVSRSTPSWEGSGER
jgi:hypothetical protein